METILPASLALLAAVLWGLSNHIQRQALDDTDPMTGAFLSVAVIALVCWLAAPFFVQAEWWTARGTLLFAIMGIFFPALGQRFQIAGVALVGPALTASLAAFTPVVAVALGVVVFGEVPGGQALAGLALVIAGLILASWSPRGIKRGWPLWAILVPLGASVVRGISQPGLKLGMEDVPSPLFALLVTSTVSTLVLGVMLLSHHRKGRTQFGQGVGWFALNGLVNGSAILLLNVALTLGTLTLVSPLAGTVPLWALTLGLLVFKRETLKPKHFVIALLIVVGGALIVTR
ncbi:MAG: DMT family transporter [Pseudomonadota bacterium]|nr:DMT family transporter [Pseudomonadota bacterium]